MLMLYKRAFCSQYFFICFRLCPNWLLHLITSIEKCNNSQGKLINRMVGGELTLGGEKTLQYR